MNSDPQLPTKLDVNQVIPQGSINNLKAQIKTESPKEEESRLRIEEKTAEAKRWRSAVLLILGSIITVLILGLGVYIIVLSDQSEDFKKQIWTGIIGIGSGILGFTIGKSQKEEE